MKIFKFFTKLFHRKNDDRFLLLYTELQKRVELYRLLVNSHDNGKKQNLGILLVLNEFEKIIKKADNIYKYGTPYTNED